MTLAVVRAASVHIRASIYRPARDSVDHQLACGDAHHLGVTESTCEEGANSTDTGYRERCYPV